MAFREVKIGFSASISLAIDLNIAAIWLNGTFDGLFSSLPKPQTLLDGIGAQNTKQDHEIRLFFTKKNCLNFRSGSLSKFALTVDGYCVAIISTFVDWPVTLTVSGVNATERDSTLIV
jgi:hypothetical protein